MAESDHNTTPGKSPAFQFYANDFSSGTQALSAEEVGSYIRLLCYQWDKGSVPSNLEALARIARVSLARMRRVWISLTEFFIPHPSDAGRLINARLERERVKQAEYRQRQSDASHKRWDKRGNPSGQAKPIPPHKPVDIPNASSSVFGLQSSDFSQKEKEHARASDSEAMRAGDFLERYNELHKKHRRGAPYMGKIHHDFQEALQLVSVYDDKRLDTLATIWLTTDHDFAENGTRTVAKFRSMISWCDERARKAGL